MACVLVKPPKLVSLGAPQEQEGCIGPPEQAWQLPLLLASRPQRVSFPATYGRFILLRIPIGSKVVPFCGSYLGSYKVIPKRNYFGAYGYLRWGRILPVSFQAFLIHPYTLRKTAKMLEQSCLLVHSHRRCRFSAQFVVLFLHEATSLPGSPACTSIIDCAPRGM